MIDSILKYSEFTCGIILMTFAVIQITYRNKKIINYNLAGLYLCFSYIILTFWAFKSGFILQFKWLLFTDMATAFAIGPLVYLYINQVIGIKTRSKFKRLLHFTPSALVLCAIIINNIINYSVIETFLSKPTAYPIYNMNFFIRGIDIISNFYMLFYFTLSARNIHALLKNKNHKLIIELKILFYYMFFVLLFSMMMLIASITGSYSLNIIAIYLLTFSGIWYFIFSFRYPEFTQKTIKEARTIRYQNSMLNGVDASAVLERLEDLMVEEKIFTDFDLTLQKLSSLLMITPHQLSKILNTNAKMNFRTLVNSYRIRESMQQMADYPEKNILEIALECGFNSKSSFNAVFLKSTGQTPSDYRKSLTGS